MTRFRKTILASALVAASLTTASPAYAYSFSGLFGFFSGWWLDETASSAAKPGSGGLYFHPLPAPIR